MKLKLIKSSSLSDWYLIERAEHANTSSIEQVGPHAFRYVHSGRITDADVEGSGAEMLAIAHAIETRSEASFPRCAVWFLDGEAFFCSPRNSTQDSDPMRALRRESTRLSWVPVHPKSVVPVLRIDYQTRRGARGHVLCRGIRVERIGPQSVRALDPDAPPRRQAHTALRLGPKGWSLIREAPEP